MNIEQLSDKELFDKLQESGLIDKLYNDDSWNMLKEAGERIVERAVNEFAKNTNVDDINKIIELQVIIRKYKYGLFNEVEILKQESDLFYEEAKSRGFFENVKSFFK